MSDHNELVKRLDENWGRRRVGDMSCLLADAADALEAMAGEVAGLKHDIARHVQVATDLASEVERLRGALTTLSTETNISQDERKYHARSALEAKP